MLSNKFMGKKMWKCNNCGYVHIGDKPPKNCPRCGALGAEYDLMPVESSADRAKKLKPTDYLIFNGSKHRAHNTHYFAEVAAQVFKEQKKSYQIIEGISLSLLRKQGSRFSMPFT